jgi:colanic acid/amylovoran biosynthesis glycosyltransferase
MKDERFAKSMLEVTFCTYDRPGNVGGPFSWLLQLLPALRERGVESRCLCLTHYGETGPVVEGLRSASFDCSVVNCHSRTADEVKWILEQLQASPPTVFVPNLVVSAYHAARYLRSCGIPTVGVIHSDDSYYRAIIEEFVAGPRPRRVSSAVCVSEILKDQVASLGVSGVTVQRIPCGARVPNSTVTPIEGRFRIAYVGRLAEEQKRISDTTRALIRVCREIPNAEAVIFGDGPDRSNVDQILASEGVEVAVRLGGSLPNSAVQQELLKCDAIVLLSDYEGLPIALLEGMACGCVPVCMAMRSGIPELIQHNVSGLIVNDREDSFVAAMKSLAADPMLRQRLSVNARQTVIDKYSQEQSADLWADHLHKLARQSSPRKLLVPRRIVLPKRNPLLESAEQRMAPSSGMKKFLRKSRMWAGRVRRRLF